MPELLHTVDVIQGLPDNLVSNNRYVVRFARTKQDLQEAQRLRFEVFNIELGEGLDTSFELQRDVDPYDEQCHHLLVIDKSSDQVIGTYRMQTYSMARKGIGFYTEREYKITDLPDNLLKKSVEVGRACIKRDYRNGRVLYLLWKGLAKYMVHTSTRYLFGCCSLTSQDQAEAWRVMDYLKHKGHLHSTLRVDTRPEFECGPVDVEPEAWKEVKLPQLFRLYMDLDARVCSQPAIDREFKTIDYLVILDIEELDERTYALFFK
ncbi:MAG: GNAT family N-acyltransferase [Balneolaceae bacterium]|nr:GNAT family N-acyltransferase [Balneolaceae bacterium]